MLRFLPLSTLNSVPGLVCPQCELHVRGCMLWHRDFPDCMAVLQHSCHRRGRRRWSPNGGFQSAAHRRWCEACWIHCHIAKKLSALISHKGPIRKAKPLMMGQALDPLSFSSPRGGGTTRNRRQKSATPVLGGFLSRFLTLPERASKHFVGPDGQVRGGVGGGRMLWLF